MKIVVASDNAGKIREFKRLLGPLGFDIISKKEAGLKEQAEENGKSFCENAKLKAQFTFDKTGLAVIADDSGLCVDSLDGAPGIYSARYASEDAEDSSDEANKQKLLKELEGKTARAAKFVCCLCFISPDGQAHCIEETCEGEIATEESGSGGFGYDPIFLYDGISFGETSSEDKDKVSHRGKALRKLAKQIGDWT